MDYHSCLPEDDGTFFPAVRTAECPYDNDNALEGPNDGPPRPPKRGRILIYRCEI